MGQSSGGSCRRVPGSSMARTPAPLRAAVLLAISWQQASAVSDVFVIGRLRTFRHDFITLMDVTANRLIKAGQKEDGEMVQKWSNDWLSLLGVQRGITGLVKD